MRYGWQPYALSRRLWFRWWGWKQWRALRVIRAHYFTSLEIGPLSIEWRHPR